MAFDLNTPAEEGEKVPDLNRSPVEFEDGYDSLEGVVAAKVWGAHHFSLHLVQNDEQEQIYQGPAKRKSDNRPRGTPITKTMKVDRQTMRSYMITRLIPAIQACWPRESRHETIWIQRDNAPSHVLEDDADFKLAVARTGLDIRLINQPANSPDMNCLDLGFFASLQSITDRTASRNMDELIQNVIGEYENYNPVILNRVFLTLQGCMMEVMKDGGGNRYKIPHMNKERLESLGILPEALSCDSQLVQTAFELLH